ncbi:ComEC/Rec2 family competence protein [Pseudomonadota bacterium]
MSRSRKVLVCLISFLFGVFLGPYLSEYVSFTVSTVLILVCLLLLFIFRKFAFIVLIAALLGYSRILFTLPDFESTHIAVLSETQAQLKVEAVIIGEPENRNNAQYITLEAQKLLTDAADIEIHGKILGKFNKFPIFEYGDHLFVSGFFSQPENIEDFSYKDFLAKDNIYSVVYFPYTKKISGSSTDSWAMLFSLKAWIQQKIDSIFPEPSASLVAGVLLGFRRGIPEQVMQDFNISGLTHILAISGYNITLIITVLGLLFKSFPRRTRIFMTIITITAFAFITGLSASVVRASIMGGLTVTALHFGKRSTAMNSLFLSGCIMVALNPFILMSDISFQLSFMSTFGLLALLPLWEKPLEKLPAIIRENLMVTLAAQVFTTPLVLYYFGRFSLVAPFANILFLPLIPLLMFFSFIAIILSMIFFPLALILIAVTWLIEIYT